MKAKAKELEVDWNDWPIWIVEVGSVCMREFSEENGEELARSYCLGWNDSWKDFDATETP